jgi:hypothetical protein
MNLGKAIILLAFCFGGLQSRAGEFDKGSTEFDTPQVPNYSEAEVQKQIQNEMAIACSGNLCKIAGQDSHGSGWTVSFQVGYGGNNNNGSGTGSGGMIYIGGNNNNNNKGYASVSVSYKTFQCHSNLLVTPAVYRFVNTYLYNMVNSDGSVKRNFSPADQTVILFYTTMLNKVDACAGGMR